MKKQVVLIHGGNVFKSYDDYLDFLRNQTFDINKVNSQKERWNRSLDKTLGDDFFTLMPQMPCKQNAKYSEWKIFFEKIIPFLEDSVILIGHSLGGIFLAKYLSENNFPVKISRLHLVAAPFDRASREYLGDFTLSTSLEKIKKQIKKIYLYHSKDDQVVSFSEMEKYAKALPEAEKYIFEDRGHFLGEDFPELIENIKTS